MSTYPVYRPRGGVNRMLGWADEFMSWFLYGHETWLVAVLKGVPLFLFVYFLLTYIPNYIYYLITVELPFLRLSDDVGFLVANGVAGGNFALLVVLALLVQAARGRPRTGRLDDLGRLHRGRLRVPPAAAGEHDEAEQQ